MDENKIRSTGRRGIDNKERTVFLGVLPLSCVTILAVAKLERVHLFRVVSSINYVGFALLESRRAQKHMAKVC